MYASNVDGTSELLRIAREECVAKLVYTSSVATMGFKMDATIVDEEADIDAAVEGVALAACGYKGQKCSACSRAIVSEQIYDTVGQKRVERVKKITVGTTEDQGDCMVPVGRSEAVEGIHGDGGGGKRG